MRERRGICPGCGREKAVTARGVMRMHLSPGDRDTGRSRDNCSGTRQPPISYSSSDQTDTLALARLQKAVAEIASDMVNEPAAQNYADRLLVALLDGSAESTGLAVSESFKPATVDVTVLEPPPGLAYPGDDVAERLPGGGWRALLATINDVRKGRLPVPDFFADRPCDSEIRDGKASVWGCSRHQPGWCVADAWGVVVAVWPATMDRGPSL